MLSFLTPAHGRVNSLMQKRINFVTWGLSCKFWNQTITNFEYEAYRSYAHISTHHHMDRVKRIWYLSPMRAAKVQASLRIRAVSPEPSLLAHTSSESRGTFRQKARSLAPLNGWACAVKIYHDGMLEDKNSLDGAHIQGVKMPTKPILVLIQQIQFLSAYAERVKSKVKM